MASLIKPEKILELWSYIQSKELEPDEYFFIVLLANKDLARLNMRNVHLIRRALIKKGWIDQNHNLTEKSKLLFEDTESKKPDVNEYAANILEYRNIFPKVILPTGKAARSSLIDLKKRFDWFFSENSYTWEEIFQATKNYVSFYEDKNYAFMQTSAYFIKKSDSQRGVSSSLAEWCEQLQNPEIDKNKTYDIDI
jgi:hypothetical protein